MKKLIIILFLIISNYIFSQNCTFESGDTLIVRWIPPTAQKDSNLVYSVTKILMNQNLSSTTKDTFMVFLDNQETTGFFINTRYESGSRWSLPSDTVWAYLETTVEYPLVFYYGDLCGWNRSLPKRVYCLPDYVKLSSLTGYSDIYKTLYFDEGEYEIDISCSTETPGQELHFAIGNKNNRLLPTTNPSIHRLNMFIDQGYHKVILHCRAAKMKIYYLSIDLTGMISTVPDRIDVINVEKYSGN